MSGSRRILMFMEAELIGADEVIGFLAALCVLLTFCMQSMRWLRLMALLSNGAFIAYASRLGLLPVLALHLLLVPVNLLGLWRAFGQGCPGAAAWGRRATADPVVLRRRVVREVRPGLRR